MLFFFFKVLAGHTKRLRRATFGPRALSLTRAVGYISLNTYLVMLFIYIYIKGK